MRIDTFFTELKRRNVYDRARESVASTVSLTLTSLCEMLSGDSADCARRRVIPRCTDANRRERHSVFDNGSLEKLVTKFTGDLLKFFQNFFFYCLLDRDLSQMATDS